MKFVSVCSGIEAATYATAPLGWTPVAYSEVDPLCNSFLAQKYPETANLGDMRKAHWDFVKADVLIGGTPCPSFSKMGVWRKDVMTDADPRGRLAYKFLHIADEIGADWFIWENVSNVIAADEGRFFRHWLRKAAERGYVVGWRVLCTHKDFALPVLRKRLFVVGHRGPASEVERVLFRPGNTRGRSLALAAKTRRIRRANENLAEGSVVAFDAASLRPVGRSRTLPTLLRGHAGRVGLVIGAGTKGSWSSRKPGYIRQLTPAEAEHAMGFTPGYTAEVGLNDIQRHQMLGNSFSPVVINAICEGIDGRS